MKTIILGVVSLLFAACAGTEVPTYMRSHEERTFCHKKYRGGEWYSQQFKFPIYLVYNAHITMHPNDYWGRCKEEIVPIPDIAAYPQKDSKGEWMLGKKPPKPMKGRRATH